MSSLEDLRKQLDSIDDQIISLLNERAEVADSVRAIKQRDGLDVYDQDREEQILARVKNKALNFPSQHLEEIFKKILEATRELIREK